MAGTTPVTKSRERIKSILDGVSGYSSARIKLGNVDLAAENTFLSGLASAGPYVTVGRAKIESGTISSASVYGFEVEVHFWYGYADDAANDFITIEDLLVTALAALMTRSNWTGSDYGMTPLSYELEEETEDRGKPRKLHYVARFQFGKGLQGN